MQLITFSERFSGKLETMPEVGEHAIQGIKSLTLPGIFKNFRKVLCRNCPSINACPRVQGGRLTPLICASCVQCRIFTMPKNRRGIYKIS